MQMKDKIKEEVLKEVKGQWINKFVDYSDAIDLTIKKCQEQKQKQVEELKEKDENIHLNIINELTHLPIKKFKRIHKLLKISQEEKDKIFSDVKEAFKQKPSPKE